MIQIKADSQKNIKILTFAGVWMWVSSGFLLESIYELHSEKTWKRSTERKEQKHSLIVCKFLECLLPSRSIFFALIKNSSTILCVC